MRRASRRRLRRPFFGREIAPERLRLAGHTTPRLRDLHMRHIFSSIAMGAHTAGDTILDLLVHTSAQHLHSADAMVMLPLSLVIRAPAMPAFLRLCPQLNPAWHTLTRYRARGPNLAAEALPVLMRRRACLRALAYTISPELVASPAELRASVVGSLGNNLALLPAPMVGMTLHASPFMYGKVIGLGHMYDPPYPHEYWGSASPSHGVQNRRRNVLRRVPTPGKLAENVAVTRILLARVEYALMGAARAPSRFPCAVAAACSSERA